MRMLDGMRVVRWLQSALMADGRFVREHPESVEKASPR